MSIIHLRANQPDRGEASRPRVDLLALAELLDRAALGVELPRGAAPGRGGYAPGPEADLERDLIERLAGGPVGPDPPQRRVPCDRTQEMTTMKITIEIHDGWLGRPEDLRKILATIAGLECPPVGRCRPAAGPRSPRGPGGAVRPGRPAPGPQRQRTVPGERRPQPGERRRPGRRGGPADGRPAAPGLGGQAGARRQGPGDRGGQEAGIPLEDPRLDAAAGRGGLPDRPRPRPHVAVIHTGGGNFLIIPNPMPRALEARGGLRHSDLADADGGRSECPGELRRGRQHPDERPVGICASWRCRACGASIGLDRATGAVRLDTSRAETIGVLLR